jgi:histidine triad (HIT) family protein
MALELPDDDPCSFCEYLAGRRPYTVLDRDEHVSTLVTRQQRGRLHVLIIPTAHRPTILDLHPSEHAALMATIVRASRAVAAAVDAEGVAVWQKNGVANGQTVPHVHFHVAATLPDGGTEWGPVPTLSVAETDELAAQLRPHWAAQDTEGCR